MTSTNFDALATLDKHFDTYRRSSVCDDYMREYTFRTFEPYISQGKMNILELGCSDGKMTEWIGRYASVLDVVDGSLRFIEEARSRNIPNATFYHSLFEDFRSDRQYDAIFATFILTHIPDLNAFFDMVKRNLAPNGLLFVAVPNARVLSRQLALHMGLINDLFLLTQNDLNHGHCRSYDRVRLNRDLEIYGFDVIAQGGVILKPLADFQMDKIIEMGVIGSQQIEGLYKLGLEYPDLSNVIFGVCKLRNA